MQRTLSKVGSKRSTEARRHGGHSVRCGLLVASLAVSMVGSASAQYISPGPTPDGRLSISGIPEQDGFTERVDDARWQFGPIHVDPWLGLKDVSLVSDQRNDASSDDAQLTATAGAGVRAYAGRQVVWAAHVLPEYVWWEGDGDRGGLAGRLGTGVFGYLNRLRFELSWRQVDAQSYFNAELPVLTLIESRKARAAVEIEVVRGGFVFAYGERNERAGDQDDDLLFTTLDRSEERLVAGIGLRSRDGFEAGLAIEDHQVDFDDRARALSSDGDAVRLFLRAEEERWRARFDIARQEVEPAFGSAIRSFEETTGDIDLTWQASRGIRLRGFARRQVGYAIDPDISHILSERVGVGAQWRPGRSLIALVVATGDDDYEPLAGARRVDDVTEWQASFQVPIGDVLRLGLRWSELEYDSNLAGLDRDVTAYGVSLELGPLLDRLNIGTALGDW